MFTEHKRKEIIRKFWCKPQIAFLSNKLNSKLSYIGLPGIEALDIKAWLDYLNRVVAFQCSEYKEGRTTKKVDVNVLDNYLVDLERRALLESSKVYEGFMEDIVMGGMSERGDVYSQSDYFKVYNLDFCNQLTTPREVIGPRGKIKYYHKLEVIDKLLSFQKDNRDNGSRFIMYLTVNSNTFNQNYLKELSGSEYGRYLKKLDTIRKPEVVAVRHLKAFCFHRMTEIFEKNNFSVEFLPPVFYLGSEYPNRAKGNFENHRMMTFTILGTNAAGQSSIKQDVWKFLSQKFVFANNSRLMPYTDKFIDEDDLQSKIIELMEGTLTYKELWSKMA